MFKTALTFLSPYKFYIYAVVAVLVVSGWLFDRHMQYEEGKSDCLLAQATAQASYEGKRADRLTKEGKEALNAEQAVSSKIQKLREHKEDTPDESTNTACVFTDDGVRDINESIHKANNP